MTTLIVDAQKNKKHMMKDILVVKNSRKKIPKTKVI